MQFCENLPKGDKIKGGKANSRWMPWTASWYPAVLSQEPPSPEMLWNSFKHAGFQTIKSTFQVFASPNSIKSENPHISLKASKRRERSTYYCSYIILQENKSEQGFMNSAHINIYCSGSFLARSTLLKKWDLSPAGCGQSHIGRPPAPGFPIRGQRWAKLRGCRALPLLAWLPCLFLFYQCAQLFFFPLARTMLRSQLLSPAYEIQTESTETEKH